MSKQIDEPFRTLLINFIKNIEKNNTKQERIDNQFYISSVIYLLTDKTFWQFYQVIHHNKNESNFFTKIFSTYLDTRVVIENLFDLTDQNTQNKYKSRVKNIINNLKHQVAYLQFIYGSNKDSYIQSIVDFCKENNYDVNLLHNTIKTIINSDKVPDKIPKEVFLGSKYGCTYYYVPEDQSTYFKVRHGVTQSSFKEFIDKYYEEIENKYPSKERFKAVWSSPDKTYDRDLLIIKLYLEGKKQKDIPQIVYNINVNYVGVDESTVSKTLKKFKIK